MPKGENGKRAVEFNSLSVDGKLIFLFGEFGRLEEKTEKGLRKLNVTGWIAIVVFTLNLLRTFFPYPVSPI